jgi:hypothetical protein
MTAAVEQNGRNPRTGARGQGGVIYSGRAGAGQAGSIAVGWCGLVGPVGSVLNLHLCSA